MKTNKTKKHRVGTPSIPSQERTTPQEPIFLTHPPNRLLPPYLHSSPCFICSVFLVFRVDGLSHNVGLTHSMHLANEFDARLSHPFHLPVPRFGICCCRSIPNGSSFCFLSKAKQEGEKQSRQTNRQTDRQTDKRFPPPSSSLVVLCRMPGCASHSIPDVPSEWTVRWLRFSVGPSCASFHG